MAAYTSARSGLWDASDVDTWGAGMGVYPNANTDTFTVAAGHVVTVNGSYPAAGAFGTSAVSGTLTFLKSANTKLAFGDVNLTINSGGAVYMGTAANPIEAAFTAKMLWTLASSTKGIVNYGIFECHGDATVVNGGWHVKLANAWDGSATTIYIRRKSGDSTTDPTTWPSGTRLLIHKGRAYGTNCEYNTGWALVITTGAITGPDGSGWYTVGLDLTAPPAHIPNITSSFLAGGDVFNISRNVWIQNALSTVENIATTPTGSYCARLSGSGTWQIDYAYLVGAGFNNPTISGSLTGTVLRNWSLYCPNRTVMDKCFLGYGVASAFFNLTIITNSVGGELNQLFGYGSFSKLDRFVYVGSVILIHGSYAHSDILIIDSYIYGAGYPIRNINGRVVNTIFGYDQEGTEMANQNPTVLGTRQGNCVLENVKIGTIPPPNNDSIAGRIFQHHVNQGRDAHKVIDVWGTIEKVAADGTGDRPSVQRTGGNADVLEVVPQTLIDATLRYLQINLGKVWLESGTAYTLKLYYQSMAAEAAGGFEFYADVLNGTGGATTTYTSSESLAARSGDADWSNYVSVTFTPGADGYCTLSARLLEYLGSGNYLWLDPKIDVSPKPADVTDYDVTWIDAESWMVPEGGSGGVFPVIGGNHIIRRAA